MKTHLRNIPRRELRRVQLAKICLWLGFELLALASCGAFAAVLAWHVWQAFNRQY